MSDIIASIIVPVYNAEKTLGRCLDSLLKQTLENIEIIVVDDGSTDSSAEICDSYSSNSKIKVIHQQNGGVSVARNTALDVANGKYIMFCDSDDWVEDNFAEVLCKYMEKTQADMAICGFILYDLIKKETSVNNSGSTEVRFIKKNEFTELRMRNLLAYPWNKIFRRDLLQKSEIKFKIGLSECEDLIFNLQYIGKIKNKIAIIPEALYHYEYSEGSLSSRYHNDRFFDVIRPIFEAYEKAINEADVKDEAFLKDFYSIYFLKIVENIPVLWDKRNTFNLVQKLVKAQKIVMSREYTVCFKNMDKSRFSKLFLLVYGSRFLPLILIFLRIYKK